MENNEIKENEIRKEILEDVQPVNADNITFEEQPQTEQQETPEQDQQPVTVNLMDFGGLITNVYCNISDVVYKKIKKSETAPEWNADMKQSVNDALTAYLSTVNVQMKPIYGLIATLATCEIIRYSGLNS